MISNKNQPKSEVQQQIDVSNPTTTTNKSSAVRETFSKAKKGESSIRLKTTQDQTFRLVPPHIQLWRIEESIERNKCRKFSVSRKIFRNPLRILICELNFVLPSSLFWLHYIMVCFEKKTPNQKRLTRKCKDLLKFWIQIAPMHSCLFTALDILQQETCNVWVTTT